MEGLANPGNFPEGNPLARLDSAKLIAIRDTVAAVLATRGKERGTPAELVTTPPAADLIPLGKPTQTAAAEALGAVLSPSQVRTYLDCSARWWFKYGLGLPDPKTSWLAFGLAIHSAIEMNFRYKLENGRTCRRKPQRWSFGTPGWSSAAKPSFARTKTLRR